MCSSRGILSHFQLVSLFIHNRKSGDGDVELVYDVIYSCPVDDDAGR